MAAVASASSLGIDARAEGVRAEAGTIAAMDGLRGLSVSWILLFHFAVLRLDDPWAAALRDTPFLGRAIAQGPFAVDLFFLISGFLLSLPWLVRARNGRPAPDTRGFYRRRVWRIVPAYYLHLALLFTLVMPLLLGWRYWRSDLFVYAGGGIAHALFLHNLSPLTSGSFGVNGALWTLAIEAQFYALLPLLAPLFVRAPWRTLAAAAAASAAWIFESRHGFDALVRWHLELGHHWHWSEDAIRRLLAMQFPAYLFHFVLGGALARTWLARAAMARWVPTACAMAGIAALCGVVMRMDPAEAPARMISIGAVGAIVFAAAASADRLSRGLLARGPLAFVGRVSYSAYLWHLPLLLLLQARTPLAPAIFFPAYVATVLAVGWISWRWVERPFMQARANALAGPPRAPRR
jgi:peptidoglycan/LPS O-acetylase OafA/YrhL